MKLKIEEQNKLINNNLESLKNKQSYKTNALYLLLLLSLTINILFVINYIKGRKYHFKIPNKFNNKYIKNNFKGGFTNLSISHNQAVLSYIIPKNETKEEIKF